MVDPMRIETIKVKGDGTTSYLIQVNDHGQASCTCPAFTHRPDKPCKHMRYVAERFVASGVTSPTLRN